MSHLTVLVATRAPGDVEAELQPYHEFECTGVDDQYVVEIDDTDTLRETYLKSTQHMIPNEIKSFATWAKDYTGRPVMTELGKVVQEDDGETKKFGKYGRIVVSADGEVLRCVDRTNPNKKWDWWVVGGRWQDNLLLRTGTRCDQARKGDIDFEAMRAEAEKKAAEEWDAANEARGGEVWQRWVDLRDRHPIEEARTLYWSQPELRKLTETERFRWSRDPDDLLLSRGEFITRKASGNTTHFAVLYRGEWHERGDMGWWGFVADDKGQDWPSEYWKVIDIVPDDWFLTVVDCHI